MQLHITTEEAQRRQLPGHDVFRYSHLLYRDGLHRDFGVVRLNGESLRAFSDTVMISERGLIEVEQAAVNEWVKNGGFESGSPFPWGPALHDAMEYVNYENLKIASGFELHFKARLLGRDFIVHDIDSKVPGCTELAKEQTERPILKSELFAIHQYRFDGRQNYLPGLKESSLRFGWLTEKPAYRAALALSELQLDIVNEYRLLRNQIHFPGDIIVTPVIQAYGEPIVAFILDFINREVVDWSNELILRNDFRMRQLLNYT
jgi:hypothetical protein